MATPDAWTERLFIAIASSGQTTDDNFTSIVEKVQINRGERGYESVNLLNGGRVPKFTPEADTEVTMTVYPTNIAIASGFDQKFNKTQTTFDETEPLSSTNTLYRDKYRVVVLWTNSIAQTTAIAAVPASSSALRYTLINGYITKCSPAEFAPDGTLSYEVTMKFPAFNKSAVGNITVESSDGSSQLAAITAYTSS